MRNNFHYGFGTRLTAVILTLLMVLSLGGFVLRDTGMGVDEPMIFDESYGTTAPEATEVTAETTEAPAETAAPEATAAPAEETPAPEATEAPAEATPIPETDSGTDTNTDTSEPEPTADPQMIPASEGEATDEPMTIAAEDPVVSLKIERTGVSEGIYTYVLTVTNLKNDSSALNGKPQIEFVKDDNSGEEDFKDKGLNCRAEGKSWQVDGGESNAVKQADIYSIDIDQFNATAVITFTASAGGEYPVFGLKLRNFLNGNIKLKCTDSAEGLTPELLGTKPSGLGEYTGSVSDTGDTEDKGIGVVYHLNPPEGGVGDKKYVQKEADGKGVLNIDDIKAIDGSDFANDTNLTYIGRYKAGGTSYYFAGWQKKTEGDPSWNFADYSGYNGLTYPYVRSQANSSGSEAADYTKYAAQWKKNYDAGVEETENYEDKGSDVRGFRHVALGQAFDGGTLDPEHPVELYAVWAQEAKSGLLGYTMTLNTFSDWVTQPGGMLAVSGNTAKQNAVKYVVLDGGHPVGDPLVINAKPNDTTDGYEFIAWRNKNADSKYDDGEYPNKGNYYIFPGQSVYFGNTHNIFSLDAVWGKLTAPEAETVSYDAKPHAPHEGTATLVTDGGNNTEFKTDAIPTYTIKVTTEDGDLEGYTPSAQAIDNAENYSIALPQFTEPGVYEYTIEVTFQDAVRRAEDSEASKTLTAHTKLTITGGTAVVYHLNDGTEETAEKVFRDEEYTDGGTAEAPEYIFNVKPGAELFAALKSTTGYQYIERGYLGDNSPHRYFMGWAESRMDGNDPGFDLTKVTYRVATLSSSKRNIKAGSTIKLTERTVKDLYAVWSDRPALFGYTMTIENGDFEGSVNHNGYPLSENGLTDPGRAKKYVVLDGGHVYNEKDEEEITVINSEPQDSESGYHFVAWYNKRYARGNDQESGSIGNKTDPFTFPGGIVYFGSTRNIFSLDAVWGKLDGSAWRTSYDGNDHVPQNVTLRLIAGEEFTEEAVETLNITASIQEVSGETLVGPEEKVEITKDNINPDSDEARSYIAVSIPIPTALAKQKVGEYKYRVTVTFKPKNPARGSATTVVGDAVLIIDPILTVKVSKTVEDGGTWPAEGFTFWADAVDVALAHPSLKTVTITEAEKDTAQEMGTVRFTHSAVASTYSFKVSEAVGSAPGLGYAGPQTVSVTVNKNNAAHDTISSTGAGTLSEPDTNGNYTLTLNFVNTYETGSLKLVKITHHGVSDHPDGFEDGPFTFTVKADETIDWDTVASSTTPGDGITIERDGEGLKVTMETAAYTSYAAPGREVTIQGLPVNVRYTVTESADPQYTTSYQPAGGAVELTAEKREQTVTVTNDHFPGKLVISKTVDDPFFGTGRDTLGTPFVFHVTFDTLTRADRK